MPTAALSTALTIAIPTFAILLGVIFNRQETSGLRGDIGQLRSDLTQLRVDIGRDMVQLRKDLNADMTSLRDSIHRDMIGLHERVAAVEAKQNS
jgi:hypothetical protein